ncbi:MAG: toprim domain-containing protein [Chloroflexi bacterium]|nr:toprim domain-containing protein [Chloroflexota bacterium]
MRPSAVLPKRTSKSDLNDDELSVLAAATDLYAGRLLNDARALEYLANRGFSRSVVERFRLGYSSGYELRSYLRWRRLPVSAAIRIGLIRKDGREFMRGRITTPEFRGRQPIWMIGRRLDSSIRPAAIERPKYLGLPGPKPFLGSSEATSDKSHVIVVEGPFDLLTLRMWGTAGVALAGTAPSPETLSLLKTFDRVYLALDQDRAGKEATERLCNEFGARAICVGLPPGIKDVAELAPLVDGEHMFRRALLRAVTVAGGSESVAA